jgi:thiol-disulfide isomerase/thioredoxin
MVFNRRILIWVILLITLSHLSVAFHDTAAASKKGSDFKLKDLSGRTRTLSEYRGSVVLLDFWATWCLPCRKSIPKLVKLQKNYKDKGLVILGIAMDDPRRTDNATLRDFKSRHNINYTILRASKLVVHDYFGNDSPAVPTIFIIGRDGRLQEKIVGFKSGRLERSLGALLS